MLVRQRDIYSSSLVRERERDTQRQRETERERQSFLPNLKTSYNRGREGERNKALRQGRVVHLKHNQKLMTSSLFHASVPSIR